MIGSPKNSLFCNMNFYTSIAHIYDEIFPYSPPQKAFIESFNLHGHDKTLLDVGCGTGSLTLRMAELYGTVIGLDPDKEMLEKANLKALKFKMDRHDQLEDLGRWVFLPKGMGDLESEFADESFDTIACFGNTLVHLPDIEAVNGFLSDAFSILKSGGKLMIQIINYDRIVDQKQTGLATIENDRVKFERFYHYKPNPEKIFFQTILKDKSNGRIIENEIPLLALHPEQLRESMKKEGFSKLEEFGSFKKEPFQNESTPFIIVGTK